MDWTELKYELLFSLKLTGRLYAMYRGIREMVKEKVLVALSEDDEPLSEEELKVLLKVLNEELDFRVKEKVYDVLPELIEEIEQITQEEKKVNGGNDKGNPDEVGETEVELV